MHDLSTPTLFPTLALVYLDLPAHLFESHSFPSFCCIHVASPITSTFSTITIVISVAPQLT